MWNAGGLDYGRSRFETFFSKEGIVFDPNTGKLNTAAPTKLPIGVEGDFMASYWVGNALIRNGFKPSPVNSEDSISVYCEAPDRLRIQLPNAEEGTRMRRKCGGDGLMDS